jgi:hypothetical protein
LFGCVSATILSDTRDRWRLYPSAVNELPGASTMKKLKLNRETISILTHSDLEHVHGGGTIVIVRSRVCPVPIPTNGCTGGPCVETIGTSGTSVINPSGG